MLYMGVDKKELGETVLAGSLTRQVSNSYAVIVQVSLMAIFE